MNDNFILLTHLRIVFKNKHECFVLFMLTSFFLKMQSILFSDIFY